MLTVRRVVEGPYQVLERRRSRRVVLTMEVISPKLLMETVEQISILFVSVFNLPFKEGVVPVEWN